MKKILFALFMLTTVFANAETFQSNDQFAITLPEDWVEVPQDILEEVSENIAKLSPGTPKQVYDYGYQLREAENWLSYPYILVQVKNVGRVASGELTQYKKLKESFKEGVDEVEDGFSGLLSNASVGEPVYDNENHILWTTLSMDVEQHGKVNAITAIKLTEKGVIQFNAYATESTFQDYADIYKNAFINVDIDESIAYKPQLTDNTPVIGGINMDKVVSTGIKGAIIGGIIGLFSWVIRKKTKKE